MSDAPLSLSVVVPCLNAAATLGVQLEALAGQQWPGFWEVIVADNGSTDGSREVMERFRGRIPGLRLVDASDRRGQAHARNLGAAAARGDALLFCDADDEVAPGWLAAMGRALAEHDFVACRYDTAKLNPEWVRRTHLNPQATGLTAYDYPPYLPHAGGGGLGVKRRVHEAVGGFDESMPALEDTDYCWRIQRAGTPLAFVPDALVHIRHKGTLPAVFRQGLSYGEHNVRIYKKYRALDMPRLPWAEGLKRWAGLLLRAPRLVWTKEGRARLAWQLGWRLGRVKGCVKYRGVGAMTSPPALSHRPPIPRERGAPARAEASSAPTSHEETVPAAALPPLPVGGRAGEGGQGGEVSLAAIDPEDGASRAVGEADAQVEGLAVPGGQPRAP